MSEFSVAGGIAGLDPSLVCFHGRCLRRSSLNGRLMNTEEYGFGGLQVHLAFGSADRRSLRLVVDPK